MMPSISSIKAGFASFLKTSNAQNAQSSDQSPESVRQLTFSHNRDEKDSHHLSQVVDHAREFKDPNTVIRSRRSRSRSPRRPVEVRHMSGSRALKGREAVVNTIRHHPSFEDFKRPDIEKVEITREQFEALQSQAGDSAKAVISESDATAWEVLQNPIAYQFPLTSKSNSNSNYDNSHINMKDLRVWDKFPSFNDIKNFIEANDRLKNIFFTALLDDAASKVWFERLYNQDGYIPANEENSLARNSHSFFMQLSTLIRLACQGPPGGEFGEGLTLGSQWVTIGGGKCAMKRRNKGNPEHKVPDLVAYWTNGDHSHLNAKKCEPYPACQTSCLIVGDFKMTPKFHHSMLYPTEKGIFGAEGRKVVDQIHDYMDMHHNRFGYVITHTELIMFQRRASPSEVWGQMDFSCSIPVSTERGTLNAMMVLWYFHVRYAIMGEDGGWRLPSYYHNCPKELLGTSVGNKEKGTPMRRSQRRF